MEWKLFKGLSCEYASAEWYEDRDAAHHVDEPGHKARLNQTAAYVKWVVDIYEARSLVDLGAGDGGFMQSISDLGLEMTGFDLAPNNVDYARNVRHMDVQLLDFVKDHQLIPKADIYVMTETIEHLENPHSFLSKLHFMSSPDTFIVASSPANETNLSHYEFHLWAWDKPGYAKLLNEAKWHTIDHVVLDGIFQVFLGKSSR